MKSPITPLTEFQIAWCVLVGIALLTVLLDMTVWRPH